MIDWNDFHYFALVAETGSYTKAAARAGVSKSVISRRISALEERLGVRLIQRTTRNLSLTLSGEQFATECQEMMIQSERARAVVNAAQRYPRGTLRVSAPVFMAETWLSEFTSDFLSRWPDTRVHLLGVNRQVDLVAERLDIALIVHSGELKDTSFHYRKLATQNDVLVASPDWCEKHPHISTIEDLATADTLIRQSEGERNFWIFIQGDQEINVLVNPRLVSNNLRVLLQAALGGAGVALLPYDACIPYFNAGTLKHLFPEYHTPARTVSALFAVRRGMSALTRVFLDELSEAFARSVQ